jgi:hypothetical protein
MSMTPILHPSGALAFGRLLEMRAPGILLPAGEIRLFHGRHTGPNRGFGAKHIWAEHEREMVAAGFPDFGSVAGYVATIVREGTPVFFGDHNWRTLRAMAVRSRTGTAIVEHRTPRGEDPHWSVITAFSGTKTHGTRVGTVR